MNRSKVIRLVAVILAGLIVLSAFSVLVSSFWR
jgi:hypothetical protein